MSAAQKILLAVFIIFLAGFTSAGALLATRAWDPSWNPFRLSPEQILAKALENSQDVDATEIDALFKLDFQRDDQSIFDIETNVTFETNQTDPDNPRSQGHLNGNVVFEGVELSFDAEYKLIDETLYLNFITFPFLSYSFSSLRGQWIEFNIAEAFEERNEEVPQELEQEIQQKVEQLVRDKQLFEEIGLLADETIRGKATYHFRTSLKQSGLQELLNVIAEKEDAPLQEEDLSPLTELLEQLGDVPIEIWVTKTDLLPYRIVIAKQFPADTFSSELPIQFDNINVYVQIDFVSFNAPANVVAPENTKTFEEISQESSPSFQEARSSTRDARRQVDIRQMQIREELYYNDNGNYSITPVSLKSISSPLPRDPGGGVCEDYQWISNVGNPQSYCVYACLEDGRFFVASKRGTFMHPIPPSSLLECES